MRWLFFLGVSLPADGSGGGAPVEASLSFSTAAFMSFFEGRFIAQVTPCVEIEPLWGIALDPGFAVLGVIHAMTTLANKR